MSVGYGFGMLAMGLIAILIGATVAYFIINRNESDNNNQFINVSWMRQGGL